MSQHVMCFSVLPICQKISMVMATEAYEINKFKTGHPVYGCSGRDTKCLCSIGLNYKKIKEKLDRNLLPNSI